MKPGPNVLSPFPSGRRETAQHRDWICLYKVQTRLAARGNVYGIEERREALRRQRGGCAVCGDSLELGDAVNHADKNGGLRGVLHKECKRIAALAERLGSDGFARLGTYLFR